jgi:dihydroxyacetone kinase
VRAADAGAQATGAMPSLAGRSNYIASELLNGTPDPGAVAVAAAFRAAFIALSTSK